MDDAIKSSLGVELSRDSDGWFVVLVDGAVRARTKVESSAIAEYQFEVDLRSRQARELLARERARGDIRALQSEFFAGRAMKATKSGKGGRGGV